MQGAIKAFGKSVLVIIWFYLVSFMINNVIALCSSNEVQFNSMMTKHSNLISIGIYIIIFLGVFLLDPEKKTFIQSFIILKVKSVVGYIFFGLGAYLIGILITSLLIDVFPDYYEIGNSFNQYEPFLRFIAMVILPPIVEEYLFRYKIQGYLKEGFGVPIAIIGQALLFGGLHYFMVQKIYAAALGILFGYLREKKGTIQCSIWMHMTVNFLGWLAGCLLS